MSANHYTGWRCALCECTLAGTAVKRATHDRAICDWCEDDLAQHGKRRCRRCNKPRPLEMFYRRGPDKWQPWCRQCRAKQNAAGYTKNRDNILARRRARYLADREQLIEYWRNYRAANRERVNRLRKVRDDAHREEVRARARAWNRAHAERRREYTRQWKRTANPTPYQRKKLRLLQRMRGG